MDSEGDVDRRSPTPCERVRGRVEAYLDGGLAPLDQALDAGHLEACAECAGIAGEARAARDGLRAALGPPVDLDWLHAGLDARLVRATSPRRSAVERLLGPPGDRAGTPILVAAAAILMLVGLSAAGVFEKVGAAVDSAAPGLDRLRMPGFELLSDEEGLLSDKNGEAEGER